MITLAIFIAIVVLLIEALLFTNSFMCKPHDKWEAIGVVAIVVACVYSIVMLCLHSRAINGWAS
jgi:hypothetical protein